MKNSRLALVARVLEHLRAELLPELVVDVLHRVDPEAVDAEVADPRLVDVDHARDDPRVLREEVVEAEEVAVERVLAVERRVAAVVVVDRVVEPVGDLGVGLGVPGTYRRYGKLVGGVERREARVAGEVAVVERGARGRLVGDCVLADVRLALRSLVADHVGGVVGDDVEVDLHPAAVGGGDQVREVLVGAEVRVDLREVRDPVAVVARALVAPCPARRLFLKLGVSQIESMPETPDVVDRWRSDP